MPDACTRVCDLYCEARYSVIKPQGRIPVALRMCDFSCNQHCSTSPGGICRKMRNTVMNDEIQARKQLELLDSTAA